MSDPPYNTGKDFVYRDNFRDGIGAYLEMTGQADESGKLSTNSESDGRYHSNWLNMMYPRLKLARNLLCEDGAVFISIDDSEFGLLRQVCNEIFGEDNLIGTLVWSAGRKNDSKFISSSHEYILCYSRDRAFLTANGITWKVRKKGLDAVYMAAKRFAVEYGEDYASATRALKEWYRLLPDGDESKAHKHYSRIDARGIYFAGDISWPGGGGPTYEVLHPISGKPVKVPSRGWCFQKSVMEKHIRDDRVLFGETEESVPTFKRYLKDVEYEAPYSVFYQDGRAASKRLVRLLEGKVFDFPKDEYVIQTLLQMTSEQEDIVLDFFAGSGTTAHAVMQLNAEDGGNRRCISVQLPEVTGEKSEARKAGYSVISQISRERIRRAGTKIRADYADTLKERETPLDTGFRAYRLVDTNFRKWQVRSDADLRQIQDALEDSVDTARDEATPAELLTEVMLKLGLSLSEHVEETRIAGLDIFNIGDGLMLAYLNEHHTPTLEQLRALVSEQPVKLVLLEDALKGDDQMKTNLAQECTLHDVELWTV